MSTKYLLRAIAYRDDPEVFLMMMQFWSPPNPSLCLNAETSEFFHELYVTLHHWGGMCCLKALRQLMLDRNCQLLKKFKNPFFKKWHLKFKKYPQYEIYYYKKQFMSFYTGKVIPFLNRKPTCKITSLEKQRCIFKKGINRAIEFIYHGCEYPKECVSRIGGSWFDVYQPSIASNTEPER